MFYNISDTFMVRASEAYGHTMLQMFGKFADKNLSDTKVTAILDNSDRLSELIATWKEGAYELDGDTVVVLSTWNSNKMLKFVGEFKKGSFDVSANLVSNMLQYKKEIVTILVTNRPAVIQAEAASIAKSALRKSAATIGTDKKSAKDTSIIVVPVPVATPQVFTGYATIQAYLQGTYKFNQIDSEFYAMDESAQKEYADYIKANSRLSFADAKKNAIPVKTFAQAKETKESLARIEESKTKTVASQQRTKAIEESAGNVVKTSDHKTVKEFKAAQAKANTAPTPGQGVIVRYAVQIGGTEREGTPENKTRVMNSLLDKRLQRVIIHNGNELVEEKLITRVPTGSSAAHYFDELVRQRYIYNVEILN